MPSDPPAPVCVYRYGQRSLIGLAAVVAAYLILALAAPLVFTDEHVGPRLTDPQVEAAAVDASEGRGLDTARPPDPVSTPAARTR